MVNVLRVGDKVSWRAGYGVDPIEEVTIDIITLTEGPYSKEGIEVFSVKHSTLKGGRVVIDFENGHWAHAKQVAPLGNDPDEWHNDV
jgi:hypothetical protein